MEYLQNLLVSYQCKYRSAKQRENEELIGDLVEEGERSQKEKTSLIPYTGEQRREKPSRRRLHE